MKYNILTRHSSPSKVLCTASPVNLSYFEETLHIKHFIHHSSWDMKRVIYSVNKVAMRISWIQIGVKPDIADYQVQHLMNSEQQSLKHCYPYITGICPIYQSTISESQIPSTYQEFEETSLHLTSTFLADNGTGQGDAISSTIWACFLDILLTTLRIDSLANPCLLYSENGHQYHMQEVAYVDDIVSSLLPL